MTGKRRTTSPRRPARKSEPAARRARAEASLRTNELQLQQILDNTTAALVFAKDLDGRYLFVNRAFERLAGLERREIVGRLTEEIFPPEIAGRLRANDRQVLEAGRAFEFEEPAGLGGETRTLLTSKFPLLDADGRPCAICGIAADITERKRSEDALRRAALAVSAASGPQVFETLVQQLTEILGVGTAMISVFVDAARERMRTLATCLDGDVLRPFEYQLAASPCAGVIGRDFRFVASGVHPEFKPGTMFAEKGFDSYAAYSLTDGAGAQLGLIVVMDRRPLVNRELTEAMLKIFAVRVAAEIEHTRAQEALRASEASYRAIFEASEDPIFVHDWDTGRVLDVSPKAAEVYGYSREELLHLRVGDVSANVPPYTKDDLVRLIQQAKVRAAPVRFEWHARHRDGHLMWHEVTLKRATIDGAPRILSFVRDVTERRRADEALRASEERYRLLFEMESDAIVLVDAESLRLIDANRAAEQLWGHSRAELLALAVTDLSVEPERSRTSIQSPEGRVHIPLRMHRKRDGTVFPVEITANRLVLDGRRIVVAAVRDITERRRAEEALRSSEEQYRAIFNASTDALLLWNSELKRVDCNPAYEQMYGFTREEVIAEAFPEHFPPGYRERRRELARRTLHGEPCHAELEAVRKNGERFVAEVRTIPVRHRGEPHVLAIIRDITERKRAEEAIRASEAQYREIFNASADALVLRDADFRIVDVNATYEALSGFRREEVLGADRIVANPREVEAPIRALHTRALAGETVRFETQFLRRDGAPCDVELRGVPIRHRGAPHVLYLGRDITAQKQAEVERRELETQLRQAQKMEAIGHLTGGIAHDFNNILTSIMGYIALAGDREAARDDAKLAGYLERAQASSERARDLIQQMLTFSRGQRGDPRPVSLAPLVRESAKLLRSTLPSSVELATDFAREVPQVLLDPVHADQVLLNLCINARDAMDGNGAVHVRLARTDLHGAVCASCRKRVAGAYVELAVRDTGPGIAPEVVERMFEPFFTTKEVGKGSGMGLATVHGIVHEHGGHVVVESAPGQGTTFRVLFPELRSVPGGDVGPDARPAGGATRAALAGRVLVVDDEEAVGEFMRELLESWGLEVTLAPGPAEAREAFARSPEDFDLVVTDQTMPRTTGVQLARELAAIRPDVPVVLYTGYADTRTESEARAAGVVALLRKPVDRTALLAALEAHLSTSGARGRS